MSSEPILHHGLPRALLATNARRMDTWLTPRGGKSEKPEKIHERPQRRADQQDRPGDYSDSESDHADLFVKVHAQSPRGVQLVPQLPSI